MDTMSKTAARADRARTEAQNAAQWLARMARSYAGAGNEIRLAFDPATRRILTPEVVPGIRVGLALPLLILQFEENGQPSPHPLDLDDRSSTEVEAWLLAELLHRGFDRERFSKTLPYDWPHMMSGDEIKYAPHDLATELDRLAHEIDAGAATLTEARRAGGARTDDLLVCWPRDLAFGFEDGSVRVAFILGDGADERALYRVGRGAGAPSLEIDGSTPRAEVVARLVETAKALVAGME